MTEEQFAFLGWLALAFFMLLIIIDIVRKGKRMEEYSKNEVLNFRWVQVQTPNISGGDISFLNVNGLPMKLQVNISVPDPENSGFFMKKWMDVQAGARWMIPGEKK